MTASDGVYPSKSDTLMFNRLRTFTLLLLAISLSACASFGSHSVAWKADGDLIAVSPTIEPLPVNIEPVEIQAPILAVKEREIPLPPRLLELHEHARIAMTDREIQCMARAIYFEARGEGTRGMTAVGYVVLNRVASKAFKEDTICGVVYSQNRRGCEFSWVCDGKPDRIASPKLYEQARDIAVAVMTRSVENPIDDSVFFRHKNVRSRYAHSQILRGAIGAHRFFASR